MARRERGTDCGCCVVRWLISGVGNGETYLEEDVGGWRGISWAGEIQLRGISKFEAYATWVRISYGRR